MVECVLVPNTVFIKDKELTGCHITEYHVLVEHIAVPHKFIVDCLGINLLEILDVNNELLSSTEVLGLLEDNLLSVG